MDGKRVFCCKKLLMTRFCPDCGKAFSEVSKNSEQPYPVKFKTYLHSEGSEDENRQALIDSLGLSRGDNAAEEIYRCDNEIGVLWRKENEVADPEPIALLIENDTYVLTHIAPGCEQEKDLLKDSH